jgi:hypothetical protein
MLYDSPATRLAVNAYHINDTILVLTQYSMHQCDDHCGWACHDGRPRRQWQHHDCEPEDDGCVVMMSQKTTAVL